MIGFFPANDFPKTDRFDRSDDDDDDDDDEEVEEQKY